MTEDSMLRFCPSVTTREPRPGEVNGLDYEFVSREEFELREKRGELPSRQPFTELVRNPQM